MASSGIISAFFGSYDLHNAQKWREEDLLYRDQEIQWLNDDICRAQAWRNQDIYRYLVHEKMEHEHLLCEARANQLATVGEQCAFLCGFTIVSLSNLGLPEDLSPYLLYAYGTTCTMVCVCLFLATLQTTMLHLAVTRYTGYSLEVNVMELDYLQIEMSSPFSNWWLKKCEQEQMTAYKFMGVGITLFFIYLSFVAWIQYNKYESTATSVTFMCGVAVIIWQIRILSKWRYLLKPPLQRIGTSQASRAHRISTRAGRFMHSGVSLGSTSDRRGDGSVESTSMTDVGAPATRGMNMGVDALRYERKGLVLRSPTPEQLKVSRSLSNLSFQRDIDDRNEGPNSNYYAANK